MTTIRTLISSSLRRSLWLGCGLVCFFCLGTTTASAFVDDDFGQIVRGIEARYHVHRNYRFLMGLAGLTVRFSRIAGAKDLKAALFEDQHLDTNGAELDELVQAVGARGWQPLVRSFDRRSGEHTFVYARNAGRDLRVLLVTVEPNEGVVLELTMNQDKLLELLDRKHHGGMHLSRNRHNDWVPSGDQPDAETDVAAAAAPSIGSRRCVFCFGRVNELP
jgi:hypothetical protein